jgi:hypothetical protein
VRAEELANPLVVMAATTRCWSSARVGCAHIRRLDNRAMSQGMEVIPEIIA